MSQPSVASEQSDAAPAPSPFHRLADFVALPRIGGLALSADGTRLAVSVQTLDAERKKWQSALWEVDPGRRAAGPAADPQRARGVRPRLAPRRLAAVHLRPPGPGRDGGRGPQARAVEPARPAAARPASC